MSMNTKKLAINIPTSPAAGCRVAYLEAKEKELNYSGYSFMRIEIDLSLLSKLVTVDNKICHQIS